MRRQPILVACAAGAAIITAFALGSCAAQQRRPAPQPRHAHVEHMRGDEHRPPPIEDIRQVMAAKLVHTQAIVEGLAIGDLHQVEANAARLEEVSAQSAFMVHDTMTYIVLSDDFRRLTRRLAENARDGDMDSVIVDYAALTNSCVNCHRYLQRERAAGQLPGRLTRLNWGD